MAKHHYIPAAYIGRFSNKTEGSARERPVVVYNLRSNTTRTTKAEHIGARQNLYRFQGADIDNWSMYETHLPRVLDQLCDGAPLTLDDWVHVAVPFVTGLFIRGREFNLRYESRADISDTMEKGLIETDNTNLGRVMEMFRLLGPVMTARWSLIHGPKHARLISNDRGIAATQDRSSGEYGWLIPLGKTTVLGLFPQAYRIISTYTDETWFAEIEHGELSTGDSFDDCNHTIAGCCQEFIYGASQRLIYPLRDSAKKVVDASWLMEAGWASITNQQRVAHEQDWYTLSTIAEKNMPPDDIPLTIGQQTSVHWVDGDPKSIYYQPT